MTIEEQITYTEEELKCYEASKFACPIINCEFWEYGHTSGFKLLHEEEIFDFNITMP